MAGQHDGREPPEPPAGHEPDRPPAARRDDRRGRVDPRRMGRATVAGLVVALVASTLAGRLGARWWPFELVANLPLQHALALLALTALALALRAWSLAALAAAGLAVNLVVLAPVLHATQVREPAPAVAGAPHLEVTFFNTKIVHADRAGTIEHLAGRDDDVVVLAGGTRQWVEDLEAADTGLVPLLGPHTHDGVELIALARDPDASARLHQPTGESRDALVEVAVELGGEPLRVLAGNPVSPLTADRARRRDETLAWIGTWARGQDAAVVVMGDLNATPWSPALRGLLDAGDLADSQTGHGLQPSYPAALGPLGIPIDHVLHDRGLTTVRRELGPSLGSDHRMVHATLARRAP